MKRVLVISVTMTAVSFAENAASNAFNGFYFGAGVGGARSKTKTDVTGTSDNVIGYLKSVDIPVTSTKTSNGLLYDIYAGYGKNLNDFYIGGEISIVGDFVNRHIDLLNAKDPTLPRHNYEAKIKYKRGIAFGVAPRFGYAFGNNLIYVKPGFEISHDKFTATLNSANSEKPENDESVSVSTSKTNVVFTPSFGYEKACGRVIFRGEYTYNPGKKISINSNKPETSGFDNASYSDHRLMIGVGYKF